MAHVQINSIEIKGYAVLIEATDLDSVWLVDRLDEEVEAKTLHFRFDLDEKGPSNYLFTVCSNNRKAAMAKTTGGKIMALNGQILNLNDNFLVKMKAKAK